MAWKRKKPTATHASAKKVEKPAPGAWDWVFTPRTRGEKGYWLVKSEPETFSFDDLMAKPNRTTHWDGVRNYTARNFLRHGMKLGDEVFFYHSSAEPSAIIGICEVVREGYPDHTALDASDPHYDSGSNPEDPDWFMVDLRAVRALPRPLSLQELKTRKELSGMALLRIGRLSVTPVRPAEWQEIVRLAGEAPGAKSKT